MVDDTATVSQNASQPDQQSQEQGGQGQEQSSRGSDKNCKVLAITSILEAKLRRSEVYSSEERCIYRIPKLLRQTNEEAYTPVLVSIGPLHRKRIKNNERLLQMEPQKLNYLRSFLEDSKDSAKLQDYLKLVKDQEDKIRKFYADSTHHLDSKKFIEMVLTDSAFIIELLRKASCPAEEEVDDDPIWGHPHLLDEVLRDIMLAENQLPFFIIADLYEAGFGSRDNNSNIDVLVSDFLRNYFMVPSTDDEPDISRQGWRWGGLPDLLRTPAGAGSIRIDFETEVAESGRCHLLDVLRSHLRPPDIRIRVGEHHDQQWRRCLLDCLRNYFIGLSLDVQTRVETDHPVSRRWSCRRQLLDLLRICNPFRVVIHVRNQLDQRPWFPGLLDRLRVHLGTSDIGIVYAEQTGHQCGQVPDTHRIDIMQRPEKWMTKIPTATDLVEANVKFRGKQTPDWLNISFEKGTLTIPKITAGGRTESQFRNLIAFEQCHYMETPFITDYVYFMDCLINTPQDVNVLVKANILENLLGSNADLSNMFNALCRNVNVAPHQDRYQSTAEQLNRHYNSRCNHYKAIFKSSFLAHPWAVISLICASLLLVLTISQAITGALSVPGALKRG